MNMNRLGTVAASFVGLGWSVAVTISLGVWMPQLLGRTPMFHERGNEYLRFVHDNQISWAIFHIGASGGLLALLPLIFLLTSGRGDTLTHRLMAGVGLFGAVCGLMASLIDQFSTPVLARYGLNRQEMIHLWEAMEMFRDNALKTLCFFFLGVWAIWLGKHLPASAPRPVVWLTPLVGWGLLVLGVVEAIVPLPWRNMVGETGVLGAVLLFIPLWGFAVAYWFGQEALKSTGY